MSGKITAYVTKIWAQPKKRKGNDMKRTNLIKSLFSLVLCLVIIAVITCLGSCGNNETSGDLGGLADTLQTEADSAVNPENESLEPAESENEELITITVKVKGSDGVVTDFVISTAEEFLRGALEQEGLVEGDESEFGLYVKVVNGERADYDADKAYWSFYKGDEYLMTGIDMTPISDGDVFRIEYTKG